MCVRRGEGLLVGCEEFPVELIIPILTYETGGVAGGLGRKQGWRWWWWDAAAVNSRLINYTLACGNILPKCHSGPCEATHLTAQVQHTQRHTCCKTHTLTVRDGTNKILRCNFLYD